MNIKKRLFSVFIFPVFTAFFAFANAPKGEKPSGLLTDLLENTDQVYCNGYPATIKLWEINRSVEPVTYAEIRSSFPTFGWIVPGKEKNTVQTGYQILLSDSYQGLQEESGILWNSGKVNSRRSVSVPYEGPELQPDKTYFWKVKTHTNTGGESDWSDIKAFRTAKKLAPYQVSYYPLVKTDEYPAGIVQNQAGSYFIDFGKAAFGQLKTTLSSLHGGDTVTIHLGELASGSRINRSPGGTIRYQEYRIRLLAGTHTYRINIRTDARNTGNAAILMPDYIGEVLPFRYCEIENYKGTPEAMRICRQSVHYPFNETASFFRSSNDILNQVWDLCKYSIKATSFAGIYVDGDRERIPYEADALINQLCHYQVDREYTMARRSHEYLLEHPTWPTEWIMQSVLIAWYDYMYTGDSRSLQTNYDILKSRALMQLKDSASLITTTAKEQTGEFTASIRFTGGKIRDIVDWPHTGILGLGKSEGGEADGFQFSDYNAVTNAYHFKTMKLLSEIASVLGKEEDKTYFGKEAKNFEKVYNHTFLDKQKGYYSDGAGVGHASLHANMFALTFGLAPEKQKQHILEFIRSRGMACSVYGSQFLMDALYQAADASYALSLLTSTSERSWYNMIRAGSTISLEAWDNKYKPNQDWNHAWGAVPANAIPRHLMGITPLEAGFGTVRIQPQTDSLRFAEISVPTIRGTIYMKIENNPGTYRMHVTIPANMNADIYLPLRFEKYDVLQDDIKIKTRKVNGKPFIHIGETGSGTYTFRMIEK